MLLVATNKWECVENVWTQMEGVVRLSDGIAAPFWGHMSDLVEDDRSSIDNDAAARLLAHTTVSASLRCAASSRDLPWEWLASPALGGASSGSLSIARLRRHNL